MALVGLVARQRGWVLAGNRQWVRFVMALASQRCLGVFVNWALGRLGPNEKT